MSNPDLVRRLNPVADRIVQLRVGRRLAGGWLGLAIAAGIVLWATPGGNGIPPAAAWLLASATLLLPGLALAARRRHRPAPDQVARLIEHTFPDLDARLLTAVEQPADPSPDVLRRQLYSEVLDHAGRNEWASAIPVRKLRSAAMFQAAGLILCTLATAAVFLAGQPGTAGIHAGAGPVPELSIEVDPGDIELEAGSDLQVLARVLIDGAEPSTAPSIWVRRDGRPPEQLGMTPHLDQGVHAARIDRIVGPLSYRVRLDGGRSREFQVTVFRLPELLRADGRIDYPDYTRLDPEQIPDMRQVALVEGATLTLSARLNKPVASARLVPDDGDPIPLVPSADEPGLLTARWQPVAPHTDYRLELIDADGRGNPRPPVFAVDVVPNRRPELEVIFPARDVRASPLEELVLDATAWDDFGIEAAGVTYAPAGQASRSITLVNHAPGRTETTVHHLLPLEDLDVRPDQLVCYSFFADDIGPDGQVRRTYSDLFLAEIRQFEDLFREARSAAGGSKSSKKAGQSGNQPGEQLARLQKQVITATWRLLRPQADGHSADKSLASDVTVVGDAQSEVRGRLRKLGNADPRSIAAADRAMARAETSLRSSAERGSRDPLADALAAEQQAYQALLRLKPRDRRVARGQPSRGGQGKSGKSSPAAQQLKQLELNSKKNRYETGSNDSRSGSPLRREALELLNRLRDLARRQGDANRSLKQIDLELRTAQDNPRREAALNHLKRLREQQQRLLEDLDRLRRRVDRSQHQQALSEARKQLNDARRQLGKASEKLTRGQVSQAVSAGIRGRQQLTRAGDRLRRQAAGRFAQATRSLRRKARQIAKTQADLSRRVNRAPADKTASLRGPRDRRALAAELDQQGRQLGDLLTKTGDLVRQAERAEPLLSKRLYEAIRKARTDRPTESLDQTARHVAGGRWDQAAGHEQQARRGIDELTRRLERAAESVLGDASRELEVARQQVAELAKELRQERQPRRDPAVQPAGATAAEKPGGGSSRKPGKAATSQTGKAATSQTGKPGRAGRPGQPQSTSPPSLKPTRGTPSAGTRSGNAKAGREAPGGQTGGGRGGPLTSDRYRDWAERLGEVEEMVDDPRLRQRIGEVRDAARSMRVEFRRHSKHPAWPVVRDRLLDPLVEIERQLEEQMALQRSRDALVPIDRDPVPERYSDLVRRYLERLGEGARDRPDDKATRQK